MSDRVNSEMAMHAVSSQLVNRLLADVSMNCVDNLWLRVQSLVDGPGRRHQLDFIVDMSITPRLLPDDVPENFEIAVRIW